MNLAWAPGMRLLSDAGPAAWVEEALAPSSTRFTVAGMVPPVFAAYARVLPPTYAPENDGRHRWSEIATARGVPLTADTRFDDLVAGSNRWGRPSDGGLDARETAVLAKTLSAFTTTPDQAFFCLWDGLGLDETQALWDRPTRVRAPHRDYHLLAGPVAAAPVLPEPLDFRCANLWWPADRAWLVATEIDGYLTYVGGSEAAITALIEHPDLDAVRVLASTRLDPSYG
ncbi:hypothetical protein [Cryptosporangium arvum]|uniref:Uncharacterized protein n=1 Tax=Cryptosporangium arvum DSM 44712 TaxID=927661 RepID=A0A010YZG1_9ACTN|nr:hypothetical protein [Cryptosporangium arvum]EXG80603.1 hypothetical protein CryarDRAFT_1686 [Cryptosporangium arvum DSM 44712]